jgi:hypothetical protein
MLHDAKAAVTRAKEAIGLHASSETAKKPPVKHSKPLSKTTKEPAKPKRRISEEGIKRIIAATKKRWALKRAEAAKTKPAVARKTARNKAAVKKAVPAKSAKRRSPARKVAARKSAAKKTAPVPAQPGTETATQ